MILWAFLSVGVGYLGGRILQDYPLLAMLLGVVLGSSVGYLIQKGQNKFAEWRDVRQGVSNI